MSVNPCKTSTVKFHRLELPTPLDVGTVNSYVLETDDARVIVDCGPKHDATRTALLDGLRALGFTPRDMTAVVLTHGHVDHVGLVPLFQSEGVPVYAHPDVQTWLTPGGVWDQYRIEFFKVLYREMGVPTPMIKAAAEGVSLLTHWNDRSVVDRELLEAMDVPCLPGFRVVEVPGHAQAAIALWSEETGALVTGDQLLPHVSANAFIEPQLGAEHGAKANRTKSLVQLRDNLRKLRNLPVDMVYPGHGAPFQGASALIDRRLREQEARRDQFLQMVKDKGPVTAFDLATTYFPRHLHQLTLILSETLGYLDWMVEEGQVGTVSEAGVTMWRAR